jgi:hypothetical protein
VWSPRKVNGYSDDGVSSMDIHSVVTYPADTEDLARAVEQFNSGARVECPQCHVMATVKGVSILAWSRGPDLEVRYFHP